MNKNQILPSASWAQGAQEALPVPRWTESTIPQLKLGFERWHNRPEMSSSEKKCSTCGGTGLQEVIIDETCVTCGGTGHIIKQSFWDEICQECNGEGHTSHTGTVVCERCGGLGYT